MKQLLRFFFILLSTKLVCLPAQAQTNCTPTQGLVAYYPFEEGQGTTTQDATGNLGVGILNGNATWQPTGGRNGQGALFLDGASYLDIPLSWQPTTYSVSFWLKPTNLYNWSQGTGAVASWGAFLFHSTSSGGIYVGTSVYSRIDLGSSNLVKLNVWQHFVFTFDNGTASLYKNGQLLVRQGGMDLPQPWQGLRLGISGDQAYDDLHVYNRALTDQEAADLYECPVAPQCTVKVTVTPTTATSQANTATALQATTNVAGSALYFDGVDDYLQVLDKDQPLASALTNVTNNFTMEAWVWPTASHEIDDPNNTYGGISGQRFAIFPQHGSSFDQNGGNHVGAGISVGTNGISVYEHTADYMPAVLVYPQTLTGWTHVAVVYQNGVPSLFVNGLLVRTGQASPRAYVHPSLSCGAGYGQYQGSMDEFRIWNRVRTANEIKADFGRTVASTTSGLVGYWRFDEASGSRVADVSAAHNTGMLLHGVAWQTTSPAPIASDNIRWTPAANLNLSTGSDVVARPTKTMTYTVTAAGPDGCSTGQATATLTVTGNTSLPPDNPSDNHERNWTLERTFDGDNNEIVASKQFLDGLGRPTQAQARNAAVQQVFASQTIYNRGGQSVLQTLAAPINNQSFNYKTDFITANGSDYGPNNFENAKASNPDLVDATSKGTLGYYFSKLNADEPLTPVTDYPYSLVEPYEGPLGGMKRAAGPGDELRMGKGRETKGRDFPLRKEFDAYLQLRPQFVPGSPLTTLEYQGTKSVSIDADGRENIVVTNKEGQTLLSCLSGPQYPALLVAGYLSTEPTNSFDPNAPVYQDIHLPAAGAQPVTFTGGGSVRVVDLLTDASYDYPVTTATASVTPATGAYPYQVSATETVVTLSPGFYRFISLAGTQRAAYDAHYGNFSYTYYDEAGRAIAAIAPNGLTNSLAPTQPTFVTRNTYDTSSRLLATESEESGRSEYVYAQDGRIRFSQSSLQRATNRFSYSNYDEVGRVVESGEYQSISPAAAQATVCGLQAEWQTLILTAPAGETFTGILSATYGAGSGPDCANFAFEAGCSADVTAQVRAALATQLTSGATQLQLAVTNSNLGGDPCGGPIKLLRVIATRTGTTAATSTTTPAPLPPVGQRTVCGVQGEYRTLILTAPTGASFKRILSATYGSSNGGNCTSITFDATCSADVTTRVQALVAAQLSKGATELQIPVNNTAMGIGLCGVAKTLKVVAEYDAVADSSPAGTAEVALFENHLTATPSGISTLQPALLENRTRTGGLNTARCTQRNLVWYDLPFDGTSDSQGDDGQLNGRKQEFVVGAVAKTKNDNATTWYSYDELGRVMWVVQDLVGVGVKTLDYRYDFNGNVLEVVYQKGQPDSFYHTYGYDAAQRLTTVSTSPTGNIQTLQAEYSYYLHGPLKRVQVAGDLQGVDYTYTLQGALKAINHVNQSLEPGHDSPETNGFQKDLFALTLDYFSGDYRSQAIDAPSLTANGPSAPTRYDGTIQSATWRTAASADLHRMAYTYDEKSQLQDASYAKWKFASGAYSLNTPSTITPFKEGDLSYDANGNMQSLQRTDQFGATTDDFSYSYKPNTNQLQAVHTTSAPTTDPAVLDYDYDALGQMTRQRDEQGQRYFTYDVTGKTTGVYLDAGYTQPVITYAYDDRGFRVRQTVYPAGAAAHVTTYVRDVAGNLLALYEQATPTSPAVRSEVPLYGAGRLGILAHLADGTDDYRYELTDHLGDARVVFHRPTTTVEVETMELAGVSSQAAFQNDNLYRVAVSGAPSGTFVARLTDSQPVGQELKRVLRVTQGDTITFSALALWQQNAAAHGTSATPYILAGALATGANSFSQRGHDGNPHPPAVGPLTWLSQLAVGLGFTLGNHSAPQQLGATSLTGWIKYTLRDEQGNPITNGTGSDYVFGSGRWEYLQTGVRVPQNGTIEVMAGTSGIGEAIYFDNLRVEQMGGIIVQEQHQYAYGAPLPGLSYTIGNRRYRYGYQGQYAEHDSLTGFDSFELRLYNSRIGRWMSYDPEGQFSSPYIGMGNNPVLGVDPNGGFCEGCPAFSVALSNVAVSAPKATGAFARIGLDVAATALRAADAYGRYAGGVWKGAKAGVYDSGQFIYGFTPWGNNPSLQQSKEGFNNFAKVMLASPSDKITFLANAGSAAVSYLGNTPNMRAEEIGYDVGYGGEKILEGIALEGSPAFLKNTYKFFNYSLNEGRGLTFFAGKTGKFDLMYGGEGAARTPFAYASKKTILRVEAGVIQNGGTEVWHYHFARRTEDMSNRAFKKAAAIHYDLKLSNFGKPIGHNL